MNTRSKRIAAKVAAVRAGSQPRVLDLFAGCGGISLGFESAGFEIAAAVEYDEHAAASHAMNFHGGDPTHGRARDITQQDPDELAGELGLGPTAEAVDVVVGGPPCQAFARVGRAKLREVAAHPEAFLGDDRASLWVRLVAYVEAFAPAAVVVENVPDALNFGGVNIAAEIGDALELLGYRVSYTLLNSAWFGVPQFRERMFLIALHESVGSDPVFPSPRYWANLPAGYHGTRSVATKHLVQSAISGLDQGRTDQRFVFPSTPDKALPAAITARDALDDLPPITGHLRGEMKRGARRFDTLTSYESSPAEGTYGQRMRSWPGHSGLNDGGVWDHVIRYTPRDWPIFAAMKPGDQYPEAHAISLALFEKEVVAREEELDRPLTAAERSRIREDMVPRYDVAKFPNKWWKLDPDAPSRTLMAHMGKDTYSHIHYDSSQSRTVSVREAARLQSFPDGFRLSGTMNPAFRQIGNAVPPLLAGAVASEVAKALGAHSKTRAG